MISEHRSGKYSQYVLPALVLVVFLYLVVITRHSLLPFIISAAFAYILNPLVNYFTERGFRRIYVISAIYIVAFVLILLLGYVFVNFLSDQFVAFHKNWPAYVEKLKVLGQSLNAKLTGRFPFLAQLQPEIQQKIVPVMTAVPQYVLGTLPALSFLFLIPFISFFMLAGGGVIVTFTLNHIPAGKTEIVLHILARIDVSLGNYLRGMLTEAFMLFVIAFTGLSAMGLNYAAVLAIIIGISGLVPYLGAFVGVVVASIVAYVQFGTLMSVMKVVLFFCAIRFFDDWFMQPYIMKRAVELNPALIVFALMAGWEVAGFWGIVFSIPVTCILKELLLISIEIQETEFLWKPKPQPTRMSIPYT